MNTTRRKILSHATEAAIRRECAGKPTWKELADPKQPVVKQGTALQVELVMRDLKTERQKQLLSLADVAARSGVEKAQLSKLENGRQLNVTVDTLMRIALALGKTVSLELRGKRLTRDLNGIPNNRKANIKVQ